MRPIPLLLQLGWLLAALLSVGCGESNRQFISRIAQYREPLNGARMAKGIPIIPGDWIARSDGSAAAWDNPKFVRNRMEAGHQYKFLTFSDRFHHTGTLLSETDHYENGKVWQDPVEGTQVEFIRITYSYADERAGKIPWKAQVCRQETGIIPQDLSLENATAVLQEWGITRVEQKSN
jgi:hypothetical protein